MLAVIIDGVVVRIKTNLMRVFTAIMPPTSTTRRVDMGGSTGPRAFQPGLGGPTYFFLMAGHRPMKDGRKRSGIGMR